MNNRDDGLPGGDQPMDAEGLLRGVEDDVAALEDLGTQDQVPVYDRVHTALAVALARTADTADTGGPPAAGHPGA